MSKNLNVILSIPKKSWLISGLMLLIVSFVLFYFFNMKFFHLGHKLIDIYHDREVARSFIISMGYPAPIFFVFIQALQVIISPIPGEATGLIAGFVFGVWPGFFYSTVGLTLGSMGAFIISRLFRRQILHILEASPLYRKFDYLLEHQGLFVVFFLFIFPGFPKDFLCYLMGLSRMPWQIFIFTAGVGRIPGTLMLTTQGANLYNGNVLGIVVIILIVLIVMVPAWISRERIYAWIRKKTLEDYYKRHKDQIWPPYEL